MTVPQNEVFLFKEGRGGQEDIGIVGGRCAVRIQHDDKGVRSGESGSDLLLAG